jgi:hypothetical protein
MTKFNHKKRLYLLLSCINTNMNIYWHSAVCRHKQRTWGWRSKCLVGFGHGDLAHMNLKWTVSPEMCPRLAHRHIDQALTSRWQVVSQFSIPPLHQYDFLQFIIRSKTEGKLNCNRALQRCRLNSRRARYICKAPPGRKMNFRCALTVNFRSATHKCKMAIAPPYLALRGYTNHPELNSWKHLLWLVQLLILIISLAEYFKFHRFFGISRMPCCSSIFSLFYFLWKIL